MFSSAALASFDLMLIGGPDGRIHRYDPINQISLGSVTASSNNTMVTGDSDGNVLYGVTGGSGLRQMRYGTGELVQILQGGASYVSLEARNGHLFQLTGDTVRRIKN